MDKDKEQAMINEDCKVLKLERDLSESSRDMIRFEAAAQATSIAGDNASTLNDLLYKAEENARTLHYIFRQALNDMTFEDSKAHIVSNEYQYFNPIRNRYTLYLDPKFVNAYFLKVRENFKTIPRLEVALEQVINEAIEKITKEYNLSVEDEKEKE